MYNYCLFVWGGYYVYANRAWFVEKEDKVSWFEDIHAYRIIYDSKYDVNVLTEKCAELPDQFVVSPGIYNVRGKSFDMRQNGVYRYITSENEQIQRIVWDGNEIDDLMSSFSWCQIHANGIKHNSPEEYDEQVKKDVIYCTCGDVSKWVKYECDRIGIKCRMVATITLDDWNHYDDGHSLVEIEWDYDNDGRKEWACYDVDNNCKVLFNEKVLCLAEIVECVNNEDDYSIVEIAYDPRGIAFESNDLFSFSFICEEINGIKNLKKWYERIMQVCLVRDDDGFYYFSNDDSRNRIESYSSSYRYLEEKQFMSCFYPRMGVDK